MSWKKSIIFSISFFVFLFGEVAINIACGPEQDPYDYYVSFFHNNVQGNEYTPFAFNGMLYLNSEEDVVEESQLNSAEWAKYLGVKKEDVQKVMYETDSATDVKLVSFSSRSMSIFPDSLKKNTFIMALAKNDEALKYYVFSKRIEPMMVNTNSFWHTVTRDSISLSKNALVAERAIGVSNDQFLKLRYAYQSQRMYRYANRDGDSKLIYEKYILTNPLKSAVKGWAMSLHAGALSGEGKKDEAAYLFSKVFASNPERRIVSYRNYFSTKASIANVLKYAKNDEEKANIWAINGFRQPDSDLEHLLETYNCEPNSPLVAALLVREVNKLEQNLLEKHKIAYDFFEAYNDSYPYSSRNTDSLRSANLIHLTKVKDFALKLSSDQKYAQPQFGLITAAYLSWMENKSDLALRYLKRINVGKLSARLYDQYRITELLIKAAQIRKGKTFDEDEFIPALKWLDGKRFAENKVEEKYYNWGERQMMFTNTTRSLYQQILAPAYAKMGDTAKAALAMLKGDLQYRLPKKNSFSDVMSYQTFIFWHQALSPKVLQKLANYSVNNGANQFVGFLIGGLNQLKSDDFYDLQGTSYLRAHQYAKAIQCFNKLSKNYKWFVPEESTWLDNGDQLVRQGYANSFVETVKDFPKKYADKSNAINKKTFAMKMLNLQRLILKNPKAAAGYYYQLGNGNYQTGQFGNSWHFISYDSHVFSHPEFAYNYSADYKKASTAKLMFEKARSLSNDQNFKAKCTFMIARCEQKRLENLGYGYEDQVRVFYQNRYFKEMKMKYATTPSYRIAVSECSYFKEFLHPRGEVKPKGIKGDL